MQSDSQAGADSKNIAAVRLRLSGRVQGVGYRPFVLRLARQRDIAGSVQNLLGEVEVIAEGPSRDIETFAADLVARAVCAECGARWPELSISVSVDNAPRVIPDRQTE